MNLGLLYRISYDEVNDTYRCMNARNFIWHLKLVGSQNMDLIVQFFSLMPLAS